MTSSLTYIEARFPTRNGMPLTSRHLLTERPDCVHPPTTRRSREEPANMEAWNQIAALAIANHTLEEACWDEEG